MRYRALQIQLANSRNGTVEMGHKGTDVQVRLFTLAPGETIPWHFHQAAIRTNEITAPNRLI